MKAKNKIVRLRQNNRFMPTAKIAKQVGVTRQYAREVLLKNNLETNPPKPKRVVYCKVCREITTDRYGLHDGECRFRWNRIRLTCSFCKVPFYRSRKRVMQGYKLKLKNVYCTQSCYQTYRKQKTNGNRQRFNPEMGTENQQNGIQHLYTRV
tara:strand:+ start:237 stop:692 length:456 start_codon:yes stop_codon:yes gene_type:complete